MTQRGFGLDQNCLLEGSPLHGQQTSPVLFIEATGLRVRSLVCPLETSVGIEAVASTPPLPSVSALASASGPGLSLFFFSPTDCGLRVFHLTT